MLRADPGASRVRRFFLIALVAVVFDAGVALLFPVAVVLRRLVADGHRARACGEILAFAGVLLLGFAYASRKGDLDPAVRETETDP